MAIRNVNKEHKESLGIQDKIAIYITKTVGSMYGAYIFAIIAIISLPDALNSGRSDFISWLTQTFLQLVLLSIIMVGQNISNKHSELRAEADYEISVKMEKEIEEIKASLKEVREILKKKEHE